MNIGQRVRLNWEQNYSKLQGEVIGTGTWIIEGEIRTGFLVKLDHGFYSPDNTTYISMVVSHLDSLKRI